MTPRPLHKWKTLWLGLMVLIFLGWSWAMSQYSLDIAAYVFPAKAEAIFFRNIPGALEIEYTGTGYYFTPVSPPVQWYHYANRDYDPAWLPELKLFRPFAHNGWTTNIPYWLILPALFLPWLALLIWRWRRIKSHQRQGPLSERSGE